MTIQSWGLRNDLRLALSARRYRHVIHVKRPIIWTESHRNTVVHHTFSIIKIRTEILSSMLILLLSLLYCRRYAGGFALMCDTACSMHATNDKQPRVTICITIHVNTCRVHVWTGWLRLIYAYRFGGHRKPETEYKTDDVTPFSA